MKKAVHSFIKTLKSRRHILQLFKDKEMVVCLESGRENMTITFKDGEVFLTKLIPQTENLVKIQCGKEVVTDLLAGKRKMRELVRNGQLKINASFRTTLLLESVFYLSKEEYHREIS